MTEPKRVAVRFACGVCRVVLPAPLRRLRAVCPKCSRPLGQWVRVGGRFVEAKEVQAS